MRPVLRFHMRLLIDFGTRTSLPLASPLLQFGLLAFMSTSANFLYHTQTYTHAHTYWHIFPPYNVAHKSLALKSAAGDVSVSVCAGH